MLAVVVLWGAFCALRFVQAAHQLQAGITSAQAVQGQLSTADLATSPAGPDLARAAADFTTAHGKIASPWVAPLRVLPYVGRQVRALADLSKAAATVTSAGHQALGQVQAILNGPHQTSAQRATAVRRLATTLDRLDRQVRGVNLGPSQALLPPLARKRNVFAADLNRLDSGLGKGAGAANAMADLFDHDRTYLVLTANNAEMRDGQGMFLQVGTVTSKDGKLTLGSFRDTGELASTKPLVHVGGDLAALWPKIELGTDYRNLGLSPQFGLNAPVAAAMWKARTGQSVDGVVVVDVVALQDLLAVTGPVTAGGVTITPANVEQTLFVTQYADDSGGAANAARREELGALASAVFDAAQRPGVSLVPLVQALDSAVNGRDILAWSADHGIEADWDAAGASGQLQANDLLLGVSNGGANKLDPYQQVTARLSLQPTGDTTRVTVNATLHNEAPTGLPSYVVGSQQNGAPPDSYTGLVTLDFPRSASHVQASGGPVAAQGIDGTTESMAVAVQVPRGGSATVTWSFHLPGRTGTLRVDPSARVPAETWTTPAGTFADTTSRTVDW